MSGTLLLKENDITSYNDSRVSADIIILRWFWNLVVSSTSSEPSLSLHVPPWVCVEYGVGKVNKTPSLFCSLNLHHGELPSRTVEFSNIVMGKGVCWSSKIPAIFFETLFTCGPAVSGDMETGQVVTLLILHFGMGVL